MDELVEFDLDRLEWKKYAFILLAGFSIIPLHIASFTYALPSSFRGIVGTDVKTSIGLDIATNTVLFGFLARYLPQFIFGLISWFHQMTIESKYYQRGYRRVYVSFAGFGKKARKFNSTAEMKEHLRRCSEFGRANARFANLVKSDLQRSFRIDFYELHRNSITAILAVSLFVLNYIGLFRGLAVLLVLGLFAASTIFYASASSSFKFNLSRQLWGNGEGAQRYGIDADDILLIICSIAFASILSGFLRVGYLISSPNILLDDEKTPVALIVSNSEGILVFKVDDQFEFLGWPVKLRRN